MFAALGPIVRDSSALRRLFHVEQSTSAAPRVDRRRTANLELISGQARRPLTLPEGLFHVKQPGDSPPGAPSTWNPQGEIPVVSAETLFHVEQTRRTQPLRPLHLDLTQRDSSSPGFATAQMVCTPIMTRQGELPAIRPCARRARRVLRRPRARGPRSSRQPHRFEALFRAQLAQANRCHAPSDRRIETG